MNPFHRPFRRLISRLISRLLSRLMPHLAVAFGLLFLQATGFACFNSEARADPPNILIIIADDLGWADLGYHGSPIRTPHLDAFVAEGVELNNFYAQPICGPTRISMMTARQPARLGLAGNIEPGEPGVPLDAGLMPQHFQAAGYQTSLLGKWHLGDSEAAYLPNQRGFDHFFGFHGGGSPYYLNANSRRRARNGWNRNGEPASFDDYTTDAIAEEAINLLAARDQDRPVFMMLSFNGVHTPFEAPEELIAQYADEPNLERRTYMAMVDALDRSIGRVLATLDDQGMTENTIVLFFSDNGGQNDEGQQSGVASNLPLRGGKGSVYQGGVHTAAAIRFPAGLPGGTVSEQAFTVYDIFPTLARAAELPLTAPPAPIDIPLDGVDLWPGLTQQTLQPREPFVLGHRTLAVIDHQPDGTRWKFITSRRSGNELYRLDTDPYETQNVIDDHPDVVERLSHYTAVSQPARGNRGQNESSSSRAVRPLRGNNR